MADQPHELGALEAELRSLEPRAARIDRDHLMFATGQAAHRAAASHNVWSWRVTAALLVAATIVQSLRLQFVEPRIVERIVYRQSNVDSAPAVPTNQQPTLATSSVPIETNMILGRDNWIGQRNLALIAGIDAIPTTSAKSSGMQKVQTMGQLRDALMIRNTTFSATKNHSASELKSEHEFDL